MTGSSGLGIEVRAAVHTGEVEMEGDNVRGVAIHIAARIADLAGPGEVYASWATRELLAGSAIGFTHRGAQALKGLSEERRVYLVEAATARDIRRIRPCPNCGPAGRVNGRRHPTRYAERCGHTTANSPQEPDQ